MPRPKIDAEKSDLSELFSSIMIDRSSAIGAQVYDLLRLKIILDQLPPGTQINEQDIGKWLGVSRTPVREAYQKLMNDDLVITQPKVGSIVAPIDNDRVKEGIIIRRALEREVVKLICQNGADLSRLEPSLALQKVAISQNDHIEFFRQDERFHMLLAEIANLPSAWRLAQSVKAHTDRTRIRITRNLPSRIGQAYAEHLELLEALKAKDVDTAQSMMSNHINSVFDAQEQRNAK